MTVNLKFIKIVLLKFLRFNNNSIIISSNLVPKHFGFFSRNDQISWNFSQQNWAKLRKAVSSLLKENILKTMLVYVIQWKVQQSLYSPGQALRAPRVWGIQISRQSAHEGSKVVSPRQRQPLPPRNIPGTHFCYRLNRTQGHSAAGRIVSIKNANDTIGRTCDLPACNAVPQSTVPLCAPPHSCGHINSPF